MGKRLNEQDNVELNQFQKLVVQDIYIRKLNLWLDELNWENEKKDRVIEIKNDEIFWLTKRVDELSKSNEELLRKLEVEEMNKKKSRSNGKSLLVRTRVFPR